MTSYERLEAAKNALAAKLPALLRSANLPEFDKFQIGAPANEAENIVGIGTLNCHWNPERESWALLLMLQCYDYAEVYRLESVLLESLPLLLDAEQFEMLAIDELETEVSPPMENRNTFILISITYICELDAS